MKIRQFCAVDFTLKIGNGVDVSRFDPAEVGAGDTARAALARLAAAVACFVGDPDWGRRLGQAGRQRALMLYDERKVVLS